MGVLLYWPHRIVTGIKWKHLHSVRYSHCAVRKSQRSLPWSREWGQRGSCVIQVGRGLSLWTKEAWEGAPNLQEEPEFCEKVNSPHPELLN